MKAKVQDFFKQNFIPICFALCAIAVEMVAVFVTTGRVRVRQPWLFLTLVATLAVVQGLFHTQKGQYAFSTVVLSVQTAANLVFVVLYDMTGSIFDFSMFNLRNDAMAILESIPLNFTYVAVSGLLLSAFITFGRVLDHGKPRRITKRAFWATVLCLCLCLGWHCGIMWKAVKSIRDQDLTNKYLYGENSEGYGEMGPMGNFLAEIFGGIGHHVEMGDPEEISDFIYEEVAPQSPMFGKAEGYNTVTVLCESLEWFAFLQDKELYPYGHTASEEVLRQLYPNFYRLMGSSYVLNNFHAREKTDISESLSLMGSYPLYYYANYSYPENHIANSLPNVLDLLYGVKSYSYHNGTETFYNRNKYLTQAMGFKDFISSEDMEDMGMVNHIPLGERNLDSQMIEACKEEMFPTDRRFNTYITTITLHGQYAHRDNLQPYYDKLDKYGLLPLSQDGTDPEADAFRYYAAAAMEVDKAIGVLLDYLEETGLMENTLLVLFSDHSAYYQSMNNYVKDIYPQADPTNISQMYRVPAFVRVGNMEEAVFVDKFTCTADLLPTILDLLGIRYYENIYYGSSAFEAEKSILYSRAYNVFMTDKIYFTTLTNITWADDTVDDAYLKEISRRAETLLEKVTYINRIFAGDYFTGSYLREYEQRMLALNA